MGRGEGRKGGGSARVREIEREREKNCHNLDLHISGFLVHELNSALS